MSRRLVEDTRITRRLSRGLVQPFHSHLRRVDYAGVTSLSLRAVMFEVANPMLRGETHDAFAQSILERDLSSVRFRGGRFSVIVWESA